MIGCQFHEIPKSNIWKLLRYTNPDTLLLQVRPDAVLKNFQVSLYDKETGDFDLEAY